jgi:hypothetical protein
MLLPLASLMLLAGCSSTPKSPIATSNTPTAPSTGAGAPIFERPSAGAGALRQAVAAFDLGEYGSAQKKLTESFKLGLSNTADLVKGHKTQAFVYCVTARAALCEKSFEAAFNLDRNFKLSANERPNPAWSAVYAKVQKRYVS